MVVKLLGDWPVVLASGSQKTAAEQEFISKRIAPISADRFFVNVLKSWGAVSYRFQRNNGGSDTIDVGTPWQPFRRQAVLALASVTSDPTSPVFTYGSDTGSFDYALQRNSNPVKTGGSYHGGETVISQFITIDGVVIDPTVQQDFIGEFKIERETLITYPDATTATVKYLFRISPNGKVFEQTIVSSAAAFNRQHLQMEIAGVAFTEIQANQKSIDVSQFAEYSLGVAADILMRSPSTGHTIRTSSSMPALPEYLETLVISEANRTKLYMRRGGTSGAAFGTVAVARTIVHDKGPSDPRPTFLTERFDGDALSANYSVVTTAGSGGVYTVSGGVLQINGKSGLDMRIYRQLGLAGGNYTIQVDAQTSVANLAGNFLIGAGGQSTVSPIMASIGFNGIAKATYQGTFTLPEDSLAVLMFRNSGSDGRNCLIDEVRIFKTP